MDKARLHQMQDEIQTAKHISRTLGMRSAGGYMRNRGWSIEAALFVLMRK